MQKRENLDDFEDAIKWENENYFADFDFNAYYVPIGYFQSYMEFMKNNAEKELKSGAKEKPNTRLFYAFYASCDYMTQEERSKTTSMVTFFHQVIDNVGSDNPVFTPISVCVFLDNRNSMIKGFIGMDPDGFKPEKEREHGNKISISELTLTSLSIMLLQPVIATDWANKKRKIQLSDFILLEG